MIKNILFDFDGVILDSMPIRDFGFKEILKEYSKDKVGELIQYHQFNGGLSRFVKIKYFYNKILGEEIEENKIAKLAEEFSNIMKKELIKKKYLIEDSVEFIKNNYKKYNLHIVSGSEEKELNYLCDKLGISKYFKTIFGSPTPKNHLVKKVLEDNNYDVRQCILIGDSINDYEAAKVNGLGFYGYNNVELKGLDKYIKTLNNFDN